MKIRSLFCFGLLVLGATSFAQRSGQSDITVPSVVTFTTGASVQVLETYVDGSSVHVVFMTKSASTVPGVIDTFGVSDSSLFASTDSGEMALAAQDPDEKALSDKLNKEIKVLNGQLATLRSRKVGLAYYNGTIHQHKKALQASLALAKYMKAHGDNDASRVANLSKIVDQLEGVTEYISSVNYILARA